MKINFSSLGHCDSTAGGVATEGDVQCAASSILQSIDGAGGRKGRQVTVPVPMLQDRGSWKHVHLYGAAEDETEPAQVGAGRSGLAAGRGRSQRRGCSGKERKERLRIFKLFYIILNCQLMLFLATQ